MKKWTTGFTVLTLLILSVCLEDAAGATINSGRFKQFIAAHTVSPRLNPGSWNTQQWITWLRNTAQPAYRNAGGRKDLVRKSINTVVVAEEHIILNNFVANRRTPADRGTAQSNTRLETYVITYQYGKHTVYRCPPLYSEAAYTGQLPVHYGGFNDGFTPKFNVKKQCSKLP